VVVLIHYLKFNVKAKRIYQKIIKKSAKKNPAHAISWVNLGIIEHLQGNTKRGLHYLDKGIAFDPGNMAFLFNKACILKKCAKYYEAISHFNQILSKQPHDREAHYHLANCYFKVGNFEQAILFHRKAIQLNPNYLDAIIGLGECYFKQKRLKSAEICFSEAIKIDQNSIVAHEYKGKVAEKFDDIKTAIASFRKIIQQDPSHTPAHIYLATCYLRNCYWEELETTLKIVNEITEAELQQGKIPTLSPFQTQYLPWPAERKLTIAKVHSDYISESVKTIAKEINTKFTYQHKNSRLRVAYLSSDFRNHTVSYLIQGLFANHNRSEFEIFAYSTGIDDNSEYRQRISRDCDHFIDIKDSSHKDSACRINEDNIDILVDLSGYTDSNRLEVLALRPAPIQIHYLGFLGTVGADFIDYIITDEIISPASLASSYTEKFIYMPHTYQINSQQQAIAEIPTKVQCGLPENSFVYCCFNNAYKIDATIFRIWMEILKKQNDAILWLLKDNEMAKENLIKQVIKHGINPNRVIFAEKIPRAEHLARHRVADIYLDTTLANARTSASDALWAGLPILTCPGDCFSNRVAASLLTAIGLSDMIANNHEDYLEKALYFAEHREELCRIKEKLIANRDTHPLFDTKLFTQHLELAYRKIFENYRLNNSPKTIRVADFL